jgi:hypothetical protein
MFEAKRVATAIEDVGQGYGDCNEMCAIACHEVFRIPIERIKPLLLPIHIPSPYPRAKADAGPEKRLENAVELQFELPFGWI